MNNKKRVACFYRVSTKQQMIDDDIPVQRNACLEFINKHPDWKFSGEYVEKGVSGFKVQASNREKLEELKEDALAKKFDIVLVYMFDRLGRIEEETPFVLKWFVEQGVEMWSVNEGQRKFDNHVDNLLNYITFWQASGESKKTQIRTLEVKAQMKESGKFLGCAAPYGYKHISTGEHNKKGREIKQLVIDENEANVVKRIFDMYTNKGYGSRVIAKKLNDEGIPTKKGKLWAEQTVLTILKNSIYMGYFTYGRKKANIINGNRIYKNQYECDMSKQKNCELAIISEEQWNEVKNIIESRLNIKQTNVPKQTKSPLLFTGYIYCRKCKSRMTLHYSYNHHKRKDGTINRDKKPFYICYGKSSGQLSCDNKNYANHIIEQAVLKQLYYNLERYERLDAKDELQDKQNDKIKKRENEIKTQNEKIKKLESDIQLLKDEIMNVLYGTSKFSEDLLSEQIDIKTKDLSTQKELRDSLIREVNIIKTETEELDSFRQMLPTYKKILEEGDIPTKKMLLPKFISRIEIDQENVDVTFDYKISELLKTYNQHNA